ncbi:hypothetical protein TNCV_1778141 [Trichonephila clavipes]|nr:hypothetical protein TNCV_1778141 [Trichonephila clavipes]
MFPDRQMPDHRIVQRLHRQLRGTRSFYVTRHDAGQRKVEHSSSLEERILNVVADRPEVFVSLPLVQVSVRVLAAPAREDCLVLAACYNDHSDRTLSEAVLPWRPEENLKHTKKKDGTDKDYTTKD